VILLDTAARPIIATAAIARMHLRTRCSRFSAGLPQAQMRFELDVRITRDGHAVVIHDETVDRTTNGMGAVVNMTLAQLRELDAGRGERIPLLSEVFEQFRSTPIIVELKVDEAAHPALELVRRHGARERVVFGSFSSLCVGAGACGRCVHRRIGRDLARLLPAAALRGAPRAVPFQTVTMPPSYYGIPLPVGGYVRATNVPVHVWTVNDPRVARRLWNAGVCGIITDDPAALRANA